MKNYSMKFKNLIFIISVTLLSCGKAEKPENRYKFEHRSSGVEMKILNGKNFLVYDEPTLVIFEWKYIDKYSWIILGSGIRILNYHNNITETEIKVPSNYLKNDTLRIDLRYVSQDDTIKTVFNVPVRYME